MNKIQVEINNSFGIVNEESHASKLISKGFGEREGHKCILMPSEVLYLLDKEKIQVEFKSEEIDFNKLIKKKYFNFDEFLVFRKLRDSGYHLGSGLKFGCVFRVYDKSIKKNTGHSKWLVKILNESSSIKIRDFSSNLRVAHSTKKSILYAVIDSEGDVSFYESNWKKF